MILPNRSVVLVFHAEGSLIKYLHIVELTWNLIPFKR